VRDGGTVDAIAAQLAEVGQLVRGVEAEAVDDGEHDPARQRRRRRPRDHRRRHGERRPRVLEVVHEVGADRAGLDGTGGADEHKHDGGGDRPRHAGCLAHS
jgi:hypothetical protein